MLTQLILFSTFAGVTVFLGGIAAYYFNHHIKESPIGYEITHGMMTFGAGIILSALALVLIPVGMEELELNLLLISFIAGALVFMMIDSRLAKRGSKTSTLLAMLMDFVPESIALGAVFATDPNAAMLLAVFIGLQNFPEAFNSYREVVRSGISTSKTLIIFFLLSFFGVIGALIGHFLLADLPQLTAVLMIFSSGGILYLIIQDIIPESKLDNNYWVSLGAVIGFAVGMVGEKVF